MVWIKMKPAIILSQSLTQNSPNLFNSVKSESSKEATEEKSEMAEVS